MMFGWPQGKKRGRKQPVTLPAFVLYGVNVFATRGDAVLPVLWDLLPASNLIKQKGN